MEFSAEIDKLAPALFKAQKEIGAVHKSAVNPHFKNKYAPLEAVLEAALATCAKNDLTMFQSVSDPDPMGFTMNTTVLHVSGQWASGGVRIAVTKVGPQESVAANTYGRRTSCATFWCIAADDDLDGEDAKGHPLQQPVEKFRGSSQPSAPAVRKVSNAATEYAGGQIPDKCPKCGGRVWDNSDVTKKKNPKAPDWKCRDPECKLDGKFTTAGWITKEQAIVRAGGDIADLHGDPPLDESQAEQDDDLPF